MNTKMPKSTKSILPPSGKKTMNCRYWISSNMSINCSFP